MRVSESRTRLQEPPGPMRHGGNLSWARRHFPSAPEPWIDLSTGINPNGWQGQRPSTGAWRRLPDLADLHSLETVAGSAFGADPARVVAVPGAEIGLRVLPGLIGARRVAIAAPTYTSHGDAWTSAGTEVAFIERTALASVDTEAVVIVNPNNPDGAATSADDLDGLAARLESQGSWLIVDESFGEVAPALSIAPSVRPRTIVIRSFGKFYGLPGVRLGFLIAAPEVVRRLRAILGDWPVSADAITLGRAAYADSTWAAETRAKLDLAVGRLDRLLIKYGFSLIGGTSLFRLVTVPDAARYFQHLAEAGILVRAFGDAPTWLRFGLPGGAQWTRLEATLAEIAV